MPSISSTTLVIDGSAVDCSFISNGGILIAGALVLLLGTNWPDLLVGLATALIAIIGGIEILRDARAETKTNAETA